MMEMLPRQIFVMLNRVQLTANGEPTANGQTVLKNVEEEKKHEQGMRLRQHQTEDKNAKATLQKQKPATRRNVLQVSMFLSFSPSHDIIFNFLFNLIWS